MALKLAFVTALVITFVPSQSKEDTGRDPCKTTDDGFGLTCSNITSEFFTSDMFFSLDDDIARFTNEMKRLEIRQSNISHLEAGSFKRMPFLSYLIAGNVSLRKIDRGAFEGLSNLKMADLSHNQLESVPVYAFKDSRISHLNLEGNLQLQIPTNGPILTAKRLRSLVLKRCNLQHLPGSAFTEILGLSYLDLSDNKLEMLPRDVFVPLNHLDYLDLSGNLFRTIDFTVFTSMPTYPNLPRNVILSRNRWSCDCNMARLIQWVTMNVETNKWTNSYTISRLRQKTECHEPDKLRGISWNDIRMKNSMAICV